MDLTKLFRRREEKGFNAVIEGNYVDSPRKSPYYKIAHLQVPEDATILNDELYRYRLYGRTQDFQTVQKVNSKAEDLETKIDNLGFCEGIVFPDGIPYILERPRAVCMKDGRIFVDKDMLSDEAYLEVIPSIVQTAGEAFKNKEFAETYRKVMKSFSKKAVMCGVSLKG